MSENYRIAYQGVKGSYSYQACEDYFPGHTYSGFRHFFQAFNAVKNGEADYAMIPLENSRAGRVMEVYNLLADTDLKIVGEVLLPISHCLMIPHNSMRGTPPASVAQEDLKAWKDSPLTEEEKRYAMENIREVYSHPQALEQSTKFITDNLPRAMMRNSFDTAGAVREVAGRNDLEYAAVGSKVAYEIYNMILLAEGIEDCTGNTTRFLVLACEALEGPVEGPALTTILFETGHQPGSLLKALAVFEKYGITLTKLETYMAGPVKPNPRFYVDVGASLHMEDMQNVLRELEEFTSSIELLGSYQASDKRGDGNGFLKVD